MDKIAVLIPCYNESPTIEKVVTDWKKELPEAVIYVYDNNSTDNTAEIARNAGAVVRYEYQQGKGNVIRRMFREIDAECYIMVDGDDTYPAEFGREMASKVLERKVDMVVGDRLSSTYFEENKRPFHNFGNSLVRGTINRLFKSSIRDIMTGYRAFSYLFVKTFPVLSKGFEIETEMSIHAVEKNMLVENVIIEYRDRPVPILRNIGSCPYDHFGDYVCAGSGDVYPDRACAELPDSDRERLCGSGGNPVVFCGTDPYYIGGEGQAGF